MWACLLHCCEWLLRLIFAPLIVLCEYFGIHWHHTKTIYCSLIHWVFNRKKNYQYLYYEQKCKNKFDMFYVVFWKLKQSVLLESKILNSVHYRCIFCIHPILKIWRPIKQGKDGYSNKIRGYVLLLNTIIICIATLDVQNTWCSNAWRVHWRLFLLERRRHYWGKKQTLANKLN